MKIIIPMAGRGSRLKPHTLTTPKPLIEIAGKPIVQRLIEEIVKSCSEKVEEIGFVIGNFGEEIERKLINISESLGAKPKIYYQESPLGTAHAVLCAKELLEGSCVIAFADTLFKAEFQIDNQKDGVIWVDRIEDPSSFGVVKLDESDIITDFVEKPTTFVSDLAIIGIYYFNDGEYLRDELQYLLDNDIKDKGEYQITSALENMKNKQKKLFTEKVLEWLDCGNKNATVYTNQRILEHHKSEDLINKKSEIINSKIIPPCFVAEGASIIDSTIGPYVSVGKNTKIIESKISNSLIQKNSRIERSKLENSMIGSFVIIQGNQTKMDVSIGDYCEITQ